MRKYDDSQPRADDGKWTSGGGGGSHESGRIEVVRVGRPSAGTMEARMPDGTIKPLTRGEARDFVESQLPKGFTTGNLEMHRDFVIDDHIPKDASSINENALYVVKPSVLAERGIMGNEIHPEHAASMAEARAAGKLLAPIDVKATPDGKLWIEDGNHRLQYAAATNSPVALSIRRVGPQWDPQLGARDISERLLEFSVTPEDSPRSAAKRDAVCMPAPRYKLKLSKLEFLSLVDTPAQETASFRLIKDSENDVSATMTGRVCKVGSGDNPLVYCWAFTCTSEDGKPYHDLQGDHITVEDFANAAEEYLKTGAPVDEMHDGVATGRLAYAYPMDSDIAKAMFGDLAGSGVKTSGLMAAVRPSKEALAKIRNGTYNGVSIAGTGIREVVDKAKKKKRRRGMGVPVMPPAEVGDGAASEPYGKAAWTTADIDGLPDNSFLYVEPGGTKDAAGKTAPRGLRHFPYRDAAGKVDVPHLRDAIGRIPQSSLDATLRDKLQVKAEKLLAAQHSKSVRKQATLTNAVDGHQHTLDLDDPADCWRDTLSTSYQNATDSTSGHSHAWTFDPTTGAITIAMDSGHDHTVTEAVPADVLADAAEMDADPKCDKCGMECDDDDRFCPHCGASMNDDGVPSAVEDEKSSGATVVVVSARADSPQSGAVPTVKQDPKEHTPMATEKEQIAELEKRGARLEKMSTLTDAARVHFNKLSGSDADAFLAKSAHERDVVLSDIEKANEVVYTSPTNGRVFRKSDSVDMINMAKQIDELTISKRNAEEGERVAKFATLGDKVLANFAKGVKGDLRGRIMKAINAEFTVPAEYEEAVEALKGADYAFKSLGTPRGHDGGIGGAAGSPEAVLHAAVTKYQTDHKLPSYEAALLEASEKDPAVRKAYEALSS